MLKKVVEKLKKPLTFLTFLLGGLIVPRVSGAVSVGGAIGGLAVGIIYYGTWLFRELASLALSLSGKILNWVLGPKFINFSYTKPGLTPPDNPIIHAGLGVTQSLVNMILILVLIYIALATILRLKEYQAQKLLPTFIIIALLVNFAPVFCGLIVDASNILMNFFVQEVEADAFGNVMRAKMENVGGKFEAGTDWDKALPLITEILFLIPFMFVLAFILMTFALVFILRYIAIWILVIMSPLAFVAYILPATRKFWAMWWNHFINWCFIGATCAFFLYLSLFFVANVQIAIPAPTSISNVASAALVGTLPYLTSAIFLGFGFIFGLKTSAMGAGTVVKLAKGAQFGSVRLAWKGAKKMGAERPVRQAIDKVSRFGTRVGNARIPLLGRLPGIRHIKPFAAFKWASKAMRPTGNLRPAIEDAENKAKGESGATSAQKILTQSAVGTEGTGLLVKNLKANDAQDLFTEAKKFFRWRNLSDQEILQDKNFNRIIAPLLKNAANSGMLGSTLRRDPRLAVIAAKNNIGSYGKLKDEDGNLLTGEAKERAGVKKAVNEARSHLNDWEPESLKDPMVVESSLAMLERDRWLQVNRNIKNGQETSLNTIDETFSKFIRGLKEFKGLKDGKIEALVKKETITLDDGRVKNKYVDKYENHIRSLHGNAHYFEALKDKRFRTSGWRVPQFKPKKQKTPTTTQTSSAPAEKTSLVSTPEIKETPKARKQKKLDERYARQTRMTRLKPVKRKGKKDSSDSEKE